MFQLSIIDRGLLSSLWVHCASIDVGTVLSNITYMYVIYRFCVPILERLLLILIKGVVISGITTGMFCNSLSLPPVVLPGVGILSPSRDSSSRCDRAIPSHQPHCSTTGS